MSELITVGDIIADWLKLHGYDGLVNGYIGCGCKVDDLFPGGSECLDTGECYPGYEWPCDPKNCNNSECDGRMYPELTKWCIRHEKPKGDGDE